MEHVMPKYKYKNIKTLLINGKPTLHFSAFEWNDDYQKFEYVGQYIAPMETPINELHKYCRQLITA